MEINWGYNRVCKATKTPLSGFSEQCWPWPFPSRPKPGLPAQVGVVFLKAAMGFVHRVVFQNNHCFFLWGGRGGVQLFDSMN